MQRRERCDLHIVDKMKKKVYFNNFVVKVHIGVIRIKDGVCKCIQKIWPFMILIGVVLLITVTYDYLCVSEKVIIPISNTVSLVTGIVTLISVIFAAEAVLLSSRSPRLEILFYSQHGFYWKGKKNLLPIGVDEAGEIDYLCCVPCDWSMKLINVGTNVAENVRVRIQIEDVYFDGSLVNSGYDLYGFEYGCGVFRSYAYNLTNILRQGESVDLPKIPFYATFFDHDMNKNNILHMEIILYIGNNNPISIKRRLKIEPSDCGLYKHDMRKNMSSVEAHKETFVDWCMENVKCINERGDALSINPYEIPAFPMKDVAKLIYDGYRDETWSGEKLFWGRIYYRSLGLLPSEVEDILANEIMVSNINKPKGSCNTLLI